MMIELLSRIMAVGLVIVLIAIALILAALWDVRRVA